MVHSMPAQVYREMFNSALLSNPTFLMPSIVATPLVLPSSRIDMYILYYENDIYRHRAQKCKAIITSTIIDRNSDHSKAALVASPSNAFEHSVELDVLEPVTRFCVVPTIVSNKVAVTAT